MDLGKIKVTDEEGEPDKREVDEVVLVGVEVEVVVVQVGEVEEEVGP